MLEIREGNTSLRIGESLRLHAVAIPPTGPGESLAWSSSAPAVAEVDRMGILRANAPGSAIIRAVLIGVPGAAAGADGGREDSIVIRVLPVGTVALGPLPEGTSTRSKHLAWTVDSLRERLPVAPPDESPAARILAERWIELYLPERPYDGRRVDEGSRYLVTSTDDPDYAASVDPKLRSPVRVQHRHFPERAPFTPPAIAAALGQKASDRQPGYIIVVYRIYLKMPADRLLKPGRTYTVSLDPDLLPGIPGLLAIERLTARYSGADARELIHVNQEAWAPQGPKVAYLSGWLGADGIGNRGWIDFPADLHHWDGTFSLIPEAGGAPAYAARAEPGSAAEAYYAGAQVFRLDFSPFSKPGRYRISVPGVGFSLPFRIGQEGFDHVIYTVMRGMMHLRDGDHGLDSPVVTRWNRPPAHLDDALEQSSGLRVDLSGGHMDAGDREKIPLNMALASSHYLVGSRLFPDRVEALGESLQMPESGNGIPDYLDELFYELDALYRMVANTSSEGAMTAWIKPAKGNFEKGQPPGGASGRIWYDGQYGRLRSATLAVSGALAMAASDPLVRKYSAAPRPDRSGAYLRAAELAWNAYATHEFDNHWWSDDSTYNGGVWRLGKRPWSSQLIFAAANLFEATGEARYLDQLMAEWPSGPMDLFLYGSDPSGLVLQDYLSVALSTREGMPAGLKRQARDWIFSLVDAMNLLPRGAGVFGIAFQPAVEKAVGWFFSGLRTGYPNMVAWGLARSGGTPQSPQASTFQGAAAPYRDRVAACWNYLLGANPRSVSHVTGLGDPESRVRWIVNEIWDYQWRLPAGKGWIEPPPGLVSGDIQHGDYGPWFDSPWNAGRARRMEPVLGSVPLLYRWTDGWNVTSEASSHTAAVMAAIALPFVR